MPADSRTIDETPSAATSNRVQMVDLSASVYLNMIVVIRNGCNTRWSDMCNVSIGNRTYHLANQMPVVHHIAYGFCIQILRL